MSNTVRDARMNAVLQMLQNDRTRPISAIELGTFAGIVELTFSAEMQRETKRRRVRELVEELRSVGYRICAGFRLADESPHPALSQGERDDAGGDDGNLGYWMARDAAEWTRYLASRQSNTRFEFVRVKNMAGAASERASGQQTLFGGDAATGQPGNMEWAQQ